MTTMTKMDTLNLRNYNERLGALLRYWSRMKPGTRRCHVNELADEFNLAAGTIYRHVKAIRENGSRTLTERTDKGKPRKLSDDDMKYCIAVIMGLKGYDPSKPDKHIANPNKSMSTARAIEIAEKAEAIPAGLTVRTVNRWARNYQTTVEDICSPTPAVKLVSEHPNQVHVIDFSVCEQYYLRDSDGKIITRPWTYRNKPNEAKHKIWAFALVDHYSNVKFIKYFLSPGESTDILFEGLVDAWSTKDDSQFPFHGAPRYVYADKGSALKSQKIQNFLEALGVECVEHMPGNPRAKGMVETAFRHLQTSFEAELRLCPASSIDELNDRVYNWLIHHNWTAKEKESVTRFSRWQEITNEQLFEIPSGEILRKVTASHLIRTVDAYCTISLNNEVYGVSEELVGRKVRVWHNIDGGLSVQDIETGEMYDTGEQKTAVFGTYNAHKKSGAQRRREEALKIAGELKKEITPDMLRREIPNLHALPKTGTPIDVDSDLVKIESDCYESVYKAKCTIADELRINLGDLPGWMIEGIDKGLAETLDKEKVHDIAEFTRETLRQMKNVG